MVGQVRAYAAEAEFDDSDAFSYDEEVASMVAALPKLERVVASRSRLGLAPILDPEDDYDDFDASAFVERTYQ